MGIIGFFKTLFALHRELPKQLAQLEQEMEQELNVYRNMTAQQVDELPDDDIFTAVTVRADHKVDSAGDLCTGFAALSEPQKVVYCLNLLESEVNNGGLCQFFVNSSRIAAPYVSEYLGRIGADDHKKLYDDFISKHKIDVTDLSSFDIRSARGFQKQTQRYPFDEFDDAFYELDDLEEKLIAFIRSHPGVF